MSAMTLSVLGRAMLLAGCTAAGFYLAGRSGRRRKELLLAASFPGGERKRLFARCPVCSFFCSEGKPFPKDGGRR